MTVPFNRTHLSRGCQATDRHLGVVCPAEGVQARELMDGGRPTLAERPTGQVRSARRSSRWAALALGRLALCAKHASVAAHRACRRQQALARHIEPVWQRLRVDLASWSWALLAVALWTFVGACAAQHSAAPPHSDLLVTNPQSTECELLLGTQAAAWIPPQTRLLVRWLPPVPYRLSWRCEGLSGSTQVRESGEEVELSEGPTAAQIVVRTGSLQVKNPTPTDFEVRMDGQVLGNALAGDVSWFRDLPVGTHGVELNPMGAGLTQTLQLVVADRSETLVEIPPCQGNVRVLNSPSGKALVDFRGSTAEMEPGGEFTFQGVPAGVHNLTVKTQRALTPMTFAFTLDCQQTKELRLTSESATFVLENRLSESVDVMLPGQLPVSVPSGTSHEFAGISPGQIRVEARTAAGRLFARDIALSASVTVAWVLDAPRGEIEVTNLVGERIVIVRGDVPLAELDPEGSALIPMPPGQVFLSAWCPVTGYSQRLSLEVGKGQRLPVRVGPQGGRIKLENTTSEPMWAYRNGRFLGVVQPRTTTEFSGQPLGRNLVELTSPTGQPIARRTLEAQTASADTQAVPLSRDLLDVTLHNMTGEPLKVDTGLATSPLHLPPGTRMLVQVPTADPNIRAVGTTTGLGYSARVSTQDQAARDIVLSSQVGGVKVRNLTAGPVELWVDGSKSAGLESGQELEVRDLAPGRHVLSARRPDESAPMQQMAIVLAPNGWYHWTIQLTPKPVAVANQTGERLALSKDGQTAGQLESGSQGSLPPTADDLRIQLQGEGSGQALRITVPGGSDTTLLPVAPNLGVVAIWGLAGRSAVAELDGSTTVISPDEAEPFRLAAAPGEKVLVVRFQDGSLVERLIRVSPGMEVFVRAQPQAVSLEVRNDSESAVELWIGETFAQILEAGQSALLSIPTKPSQPSLQARAVKGGRIWMMSGVALPDHGKFAWILSE